MVVFIAWYRLRKRDGKAVVKRWEGVAARPRATRSSSPTWPRHDLLADAAAEALDHAVRRGGPHLDLRDVHDPRVEGAGRGAAPGRPRAVPRARSRTRARRASIVAMFVFAGGRDPALRRAIRARRSSRPARLLGISEFFLVQWLAPLASEAPELLIAGLYAWRLNTNAGLGTLVSSKVNQWTLLVGTLPIVFSIAAGRPARAADRSAAARGAVPHRGAVLLRGRDPRRTSRCRSARRGCCSGCSGRSSSSARSCPKSWHAAELIGVGIIYLLLGLRLILRDRARLPKLLRDGFRTPHAELYARGDPPVGDGG